MIWHDWERNWYDQNQRHSFQLFGVQGGYGGCCTGNGKMGEMGRTGLCGQFCPLFHFQCNIHLIHSVKQISSLWSAEADALTVPILPSSERLSESPPPRSENANFWLLKEETKCTVQPLWKKYRVGQKKFVLGCVIPPLAAKASSRNLQDTLLLTNSVLTKIPML